MEDPKYVYDVACFNIGSEGRKGMRKTQHSLQDTHPSNFLQSRGGMTSRVDLWPLMEQLPVSRLINAMNMEQR
jgi:hypothetical protein